MALRFDGVLVLREVVQEHTANGRAVWEQTAELRLVDGSDVISFGQGAQTDLGSVPQFAWSFGFPPDGMGVRAYAIHDLLYRTKGFCGLPGGASYRSRVKPYTRAEADEILRKGLIVCGVPDWRARAIWVAVRAGGAFSWGT